MKKYGLIGAKLDYSYSKIIHEFLIEKFQLDATYDLIELTKQEVTRERLLQYDGLNVTNPYKEVVIDLLDEMHIDFPVCNTIKRTEHTLAGYNTDIDGLNYLLTDIKKLGGPRNVKRVAIFGTGATSKMVQYLYQDKEVTIFSRSNKPGTVSYDAICDVKADVLINTTPIGMNTYESLLPLEHANNFGSIVDLNYNPMNSKLKIDAGKAKVPFIGGLHMLIHQAIRSFEIWHEIEVDAAVQEELYRKLCFQIFPKRAIIGMSLAGKTTVVKKMGGIDLDEAILKRSDASIAEMLALGTFRQKETQVLSELVEENNELIALGGGAILVSENIELLKDYLIIWLATPVEELLSRRQENHRPLLVDDQTLIKLYEERKPLYQMHANIKVTADELEEVLS